VRAWYSTWQGTLPFIRLLKFKCGSPHRHQIVIDRDPQQLESRFGAVEGLGYPSAFFGAGAIPATERNTITNSHGPRLLTQLEPSCGRSDEVLAAGPSAGSLKYEHHFGLDCFSIWAEHWTLQALLTHSINDDCFVASGLDAAAFAATGLGRTGLVGGKICSVGATSCSTGFSRSKLPLSAHPARARARSVADTHCIFCSYHAGSDTFRCIMRSLQALKE
jgi:hypothetical protein